LRPTVGWLSHQQYLQSGIQHSCSKLDGVSDPLHCGDSSSTKVRAVHHRGVHLDRALLGPYRTATRVEFGIILQHTHGSHYSLERGTPAPEHVASCLHRREAASKRGRLALRAPVACTTMHHTGPLPHSFESGENGVQMQFVCAAWRVYKNLP
jgi:hypothetical protein